MKETLKLKKTAEKIIGAVRVAPDVFDKIQYIAKTQKVSNQTVVRAILEQFIDRIY